MSRTGTDTGALKGREKWEHAHFNYRVIPMIYELRVLRDEINDVSTDIVIDVDKDGKPLMGTLERDGYTGNDRDERVEMYQRFFMEHRHVVLASLNLALSKYGFYEKTYGFNEKEREAITFAPFWDLAKTSLDSKFLEAAQHYANRGLIETLETRYDRLKELHPFKGMDNNPTFPISFGTLSDRSWELARDVVAANKNVEAMRHMLEKFRQDLGVKYEIAHPKYTARIGPANAPYRREQFDFKTIHSKLKDLKLKN